MRYSSRIFLYAPFAALCLLFAATSFIWWREAGLLSRQLDALNGHEIMPGIRMQFAAKTIGGFPFRVDATFKNFALIASGPRGFAWRSEEFAMHRLTYGDTRIVFEAGGQQRFNWRREDDSNGEFAFLPGSIRASAVTRGGGMARFDCVLVALDSPSLTIGNAELHLRASPSADALDLAVSVKTVRDSGKPRDDRALRAQITPRKALHGLLHGEQDWRAALETWRQSGGALIAQAQNRITLDASHRLMGQLFDRRIDTAPLY